MSALIDALYAQADEFIAIRRDIHSEPELGFEEFRTSDLVAEKLIGWGYAVERGIGGTGLVAQLKRGDGKLRVGLRADMDALPIVEANSFGYSSRRTGVMHACGHDGHTAILLAAAHYLAKSGRFSGTVNLIFQPAEEGQGGAVRMLKEGLFDKYPCDAIFAMHNMPSMPQGTFHLRDGAAMASSDEAIITLHGNGGHGAFPHRTTDSIVAASSIVIALQTIVSRNIDPLDTAVVTVGSINSGVASNVIPASAKLKLSIRALNREVRDKLEARIRALVTAQAESFGVRAEIEYNRNYAVLVNTKAETDFAASVARDLVGAERTTYPCVPLTGSEDFAFMLEKLPGCYLFIGNGDGSPGIDGKPTSACMVHNPGYDFNDANIGMGSAYWVALVQRYLPVEA